MRFLLRSLGTLLLAIAVVFAVGDIARSIADEATRLVTISEALASLDIGQGAGGGAATNDILTVIGEWSMALTAGVAGVALLLLGRKKHRRSPLVRR